MARAGGVLSLFVVVLTMALVTPAAAQDPITSTSTTATSTTAEEVPTRDIVPKPNSGAAPDDAGDRGGALQLGLLGLVVVVIAGAVAGLVRQSRRARQTGAG